MRWRFRKRFASCGIFVFGDGFDVIFSLFVLVFYRILLQGTGVCNITRLRLLLVHDSERGGVSLFIFNAREMVCIV